MLLVALLVSLCMPMMAQKYYNFNAVALDVDGLPQKVVESWVTGNAGTVINPNAPGEVGTEAISKYVVGHDWDVVGVTQDFNFHSNLVSQFTRTVQIPGDLITVTNEKNQPSNPFTAVDGYIGDDVTYATAKGSGSSNPSISSNQLYVYKNNQLTFETTKPTVSIKKIVITCYHSDGFLGILGATDYVGGGTRTVNYTKGNATKSMTPSVSGNVITISVSGGADKVQLSHTGNTEMRIVSVVVTYDETEEQLSYTSQEVTDYYATANPAGADGANIVDGDARENNDGVCLIYSSNTNYSVTGGNRVPWNNSSTGDEDDDFVRRGYRMYTVTIAEGVLADVYVLNLDAGTRSSDITARTNQLNQLADVILANTNKRPIIVMGTLNTLYTRENLKTNFIDKINNSGKGFTIKDAWVELKRGGEYPTYGTEDELANTGYYDSQQGEVYNKMFYINRSGNALTIKPNTYQREVGMLQVDHAPITVNFTVTDPNGQSSSNSDWTVDDGEISEPEVTIPAGNQVASGTTYYVKNVSTGLYLKSGANWATRATEGSAGMEITPEAANTKYTLKTLAGSMSAVADPYMDNGDNTSWTLKPVDGTSYQYYLMINDDQALSSTGEAHDVVRCKAFDPTDDRQKWMFLTEEQIKSQMTNATPSNPYDITPLVKAASFDRLYIGNEETKDGVIYDYWPVLSFNNLWGADNPTHNGIAHYTTNPSSTKTVSRVMTDMPSGRYVVSFEGYYRARALCSAAGLGLIGNRQDYLWDVVVSLGDASASVMQNMNVTMDDWQAAARTFRDNDEYLTTFQCSHSGGLLTLSISIPRFTGGDSGRDTWLALDNFVIKYLGPESDYLLKVKELVRNYINMTAQKVAQLNEAGQNAYDISEVIYRYENNLLSEDGSLEIAMIDAAYELALKAHNAFAAEQGSNGGDFTGLIVNPSFEDGNVGWDIQGWGIGAQPNANSAQQVDNDSRVGNYLLDAYHSNGTYSDVPATTQTITGLKNGLYLLQAKVTSFGPGEDGVPANAPGNTVYLIGNNYHKGVIAATKTSFKEGELYFLVEDGTAKIGVVGGYNGYFYPTGCFYKADDFRLKYVCDLTNGRVKLALDEAKSVAATFDVAGQNAWKTSTVYSTYQAYISNSSTSAVPSVSSSDLGITEAKNVYDALTTAALQQKSVGCDMTWCLGDPSFELGKYKSVWTTTSGWDTRVVMQNDPEYAAVGAQGSYLFNTWNDQVGATNSGKNAAITKSITGLPNGTYRLTVMAASDAGKTVYLVANNKRASVTMADGDGLAAKSRMHQISLDFEVTNGQVDIRVVGGDAEGAYVSTGGCWYKIDDFHLQLLFLNETLDENTSRILYLSENASYLPEIDFSSDDNATARTAYDNVYSYEQVVVQRTISSGKWSTLVLPFDLPVGDLGDGNWDVRELSSIENDTEATAVLKFVSLSGDNPTITAGKCYIVRHTEDNLTEISVDVEDVVFNTTTFDNSYTDNTAQNIEFIGTYTSGYMPVGAYFITNNKFKKVVKANTNAIKGFRAYFVVGNSGSEDGEVRSLSFRIGESTDIESVNNEEPTVVGIYNLNGVRLDDMQEGVNILRMSDGTSVKVLIK